MKIRRPRTESVKSIFNCRLLAFFLVVPPQYQIVEIQTILQSKLPGLHAGTPFIGGRGELPPPSEGHRADVTSGRRQCRPSARTDPVSAVLERFQVISIFRCLCIVPFNYSPFLINTYPANNLPGMPTTFFF